MSDLLICVQRCDFPADIPHSFFLPESSPTVLCGPTELLERQRIALLNSRQSPRISDQSHWWRSTLDALHSLDPNHHVIVSSLGTTAWDFVAWAAGKMGFPVILIFPGGSAQNFKIARTKAVMNLGFDERKTLALRPLLLTRYRQKSEINALRDAWVLALSHRYIPISVRKGGNISFYLSRAELDDRDLDNRFQIEYRKPTSLRTRRLPREIRLPGWYKPDDYLIHWTRSCNGPWPDETIADYFGRVVSGKDDSQNGFNTLVHILKEGCIRASGHLIRGNYPVVPFTERSPQDLIALMKWRSGLRRWTFEPYGIALKKSQLVKIGARPVIYGDLSDFEAMPDDERPFFQMAESGNIDWRSEKEWRILGNVDLHNFNNDLTVIIVGDTDTAARLTEKFSCRVFTLNAG